jgi:hypothetical protein
MRGLFAALVVAAALHTAPAMAGGLTLQTSFTPEQQGAADGLRGKASAGHFPPAERKKGANGLLFLAIAAQHADDPATFAAALEAMSESWSAKGSGANPAVNEDYRTVVRAGLAHTDAKVLGAAVLASRLVLVAGGDAATVDALVRLGTTHTDHTLRWMVLDNLWNLKDFQKGAATAGVYVAGLDATEPWMISMAHFRIQTSGYFGLAPAADVRTRALAQVKHADPGVRGRAIRTLAAIASTPADKDAAGVEAERMLVDTSPYVRAEAINAIGKLQRKSAIPTIGKLLDDKGVATYDLGGFTLPTGTAGKVHHDGSPWSRVDDAVIQNLKTLTSSLAAGKYEFTPIRWDHKDEDLATAVAGAKKWLAAYKP